MQTFFESKLFPQTLKAFEMPVAPREHAAFFTALTKYAQQRLATVNHNVEQLETQLAYFLKKTPQTALRFDLVVDETEGYVDVEMGRVIDGAFVPGEFSGTGFMFDALEADRREFPELRDAREHSGDEAPTANLMYAAQFSVVGRMARAMIDVLRGREPWSTFTFFGRVMSTSQRDFVCDWPTETPKQSKRRK